MAEPASIIGSDVTILGNVSGGEDLVLAGRVDGRITLTRHLVVEESGAVLQGAEVEDLTVRGRLEGEVVATGGVTIEAGAVVVGDISTPRLSIAEGARVQGRVSMDVELPEQ